MKAKVLVAAVWLLALASLASADTIRIRGINIDFVNIGHAGNSSDIYGWGAVGYGYKIGKYEITNAQWNTFVNAAGAPRGSDSYAYEQSSHWTGLQQPTNNVSWYEAAQFCNYLTSGDKSKGAYKFSGNNTNPGSFQGINRTAAQTTYGTIYVIPTKDEWYKAAYYKPNGSGYTMYANGTDSAPTAGTSSNYNKVIGQPWNVGTGTMEQNGTFDMMGNVWEWVDWSNNGELRGGTYNDDWIAASVGASTNRSNSDWTYGFRIAAVPEPATLSLLALGGLVLRRRK
jgi:sulfatase modifying factor 1